MHRRRLFPLFLLLYTILGPPQPAYCEDTPTTVPATPSPAPVPLEEVAARSQEVVALLRDVEDGLQPKPEIETIRKELPKWGSRVEELQMDAMQVLASTPSRTALDAVEGPLVTAGKKLDEWKVLLTTRGRELESFINQLEGMRDTWAITRKAARKEKAPAALLTRIDETVAAVGKTLTHLEERRDDLLVLQDHVARLIARTDEVQRDIDRRSEDIVSRLGERTDPRIWELDWASVASRRAAAEGSSSLARQLVVLRDYAVSNFGYIAFNITLFVALIPLLARIRKRIPTWVERNPQVGRATPVVALPGSSAFLASLLITIWFYPPGPRVFGSLLGLISLIPMVRILRRLVDREFLPVIYAFATFFVLDRLRRFADLPPETLQVLFVLQMLISIGAVFWLVSTGRLSLTGHASGPIVPRIIDYAGRGLIGVFAVSLIAACLGYMRFAEWLASGFLSSGYLAIGSYATYRVGQGLVAYALRSDIGRLLKMSQHPSVERHLNAALRWLAAMPWLFGTLLLFDLVTPLWSGVSTALTAEFALGEINLSLGDLIAFGITVWLSFALSRFTRFVLDEDVFPRFPLARGVPYAVSTLVHYTVLLVGFLLAFAAMGIDLNRFTILAGAFGVGIGFGMQNIVNNFVSGIILLFERPIQVGDTIQMGELVGEVKRIGIRSSAVRTWQGAEVIVPNASFISESVTNWTLSDRLRRIDVKVGVAYGTDPVLVLELLTKVATDHPLVLTEPPSVALFLGFGDSALDFELRAWTNRFEQWVRIRSELNVAVNAALRDAKITIPFPQRDVHLDSLRAVDVRIVDPKK